MEIEDSKKLLKIALVNSFVEDYKLYKNTINHINQNLTDKNVDFKYTYDEFCVDFLELSLKSIENNDIFKFDKYETFYSNFLEFNQYNLKNMLSDKLDELGYKYDEIYDIIMLNSNEI